MDAVMYGMTPNAKIDSWSMAPPEKRFTRPMKFSEGAVHLGHALVDDVVIDARVGMNEPIR